MLDQKLPILDSSDSAIPRANAVHAQQDQLQQAYSGPSESAATPPTGLAACLVQLLGALGWNGDSRHLIEVLPHLQGIDDVETFRAVLVRLNYTTDGVAVAAGPMPNVQPPCFFTPDGRKILLFTAAKSEGYEFFDSESGKNSVLKELPVSGQLFFPRFVDAGEVQAELTRRNWSGILAKRFRGTLIQLLLTSLVINVLALLPSLFILAVYDNAIATKSVRMLLYLLTGISLCLAAEYGFRQIRGRALSYLGARWDVITGAKALERVLYLPISFTERGPVSAQITRLRQFENLREIFSGQMAIAVLDLPFILIYVAAIGFVGGPLVWAPILLLVTFALVGLTTVPVMKRRFAMVGESRQRMLRLLMETVTKHRAIKESGAEAVWFERLKTVAQESASRHFSSEQLNLNVMSITQALSSIAGLATLFVGLDFVINGKLSVGSLIATMAIVWRFMSPVQSAFLNFNRFQQVSNAFRQANQLFRMPPERDAGALPKLFRSFRGNIVVNRLSFRYTATSDPALNGVSLRIPAGQLVAITGPSGGGKSTLFRLIAKLYLPQGGTIQVDGVDIRQVDTGELRQSISYVPDFFDFFHGTVAQNLRLAAPTASDLDLKKATAEARIQDYASTLPNGLDTWLKADLAAKLPSGLKQRIMLARAWVKNVPIYLLDEPVNNLDRIGEEALLQKIEALRGKATILMVTHRPSHMNIADRVIYMQEGQVLFDGKPDQIIPLILQAA